MFLPSTMVTTPLTVNFAFSSPFRASSIGTIVGAWTITLYSKVAISLSTPSSTALTWMVTSSVIV